MGEEHGVRLPMGRTGISSGLLWCMSDMNIKALVCPSASH